jgi:SH3-like domain-containing protein
VRIGVPSFDRSPLSKPLALRPRLPAGPSGIALAAIAFVLGALGGARDAAATKCMPDQFLKFFPRSERCEPAFAGTQSREAELVGDKPLTLYFRPSEQSAIVGEGFAPSKSVEIIGGCSRAWCYVRVGWTTGWLARERLALTPAAGTTGTPAAAVEKPVAAVDEPVAVAKPPVAVAAAKPVVIEERADAEQNPPAVTKVALVAPPPLPVRALRPPPRPYYVLSQTASAEPTGADLQQPVAGGLVLTAIQKKTYAISGLEPGASLPVRGYHEDKAALLGAIPASARDVEATGLCVEDWCLVRRGELRGWIKRRYLVDETRRFGFNGLAPWSALEVYDLPSDDAKVVGQIASPARAIESVGDCGKDWCHIRYFDLAGWVRTSELTPQ